VTASRHGRRRTRHSTALPADRGTSKSKKADPSGHAAGGEEARLLETVPATLSEEEIRRVLVGALLCMDAAGREGLFVRLGAETGATLRSVLEPTRKDRETQAPTPGKRKVQQEGQALWDDWDECIAEAGQEGGKYVQQDEHWEPSWLETSGLAEDLEKIAAGMHDAPESCRQLIVDWRAAVAESSVRTTTSREGVPELDWLHALVDAILAAADGGAFREAVRTSRVSGSPSDRRSNTSS
jgi:hypothetical protein